ncbi:hypothetical protein BH10ACI4_BH10ACI4_30630 [soil metagenome]
MAALDFNFLRRFAYGEPAKEIGEQKEGFFGIPQGMPFRKPLNSTISPKLIYIDTPKRESFHPVS